MMQIASSKATTFKNFLSKSEFYRVQFQLFRLSQIHYTDVEIEALRIWLDICTLTITRRALAAAAANSAKGGDIKHPLKAKLRLKAFDLFALVAAQPRSANFRANISPRREKTKMGGCFQTQIVFFFFFCL